jgi:hypothetical protein
MPWTIWVKQEVKAEGLRIAEQEGVSPSAVGAALMEEAVHQKLHTQHAILLQPMIKQAVREQMAAFVPLLVRVAFEAGQTRSLVTNILGRQPGVSSADLKTILEGSGESAKANIRRRTPQMAELTEAVQRWMGGEGEAQPVSDGDRQSQLYQKPGRS